MDLQVHLHSLILKHTMNEDALNEIEDCTLKKCVICKSDESRDYDK